VTTSELMKAMSDAGAPFEAILIAVQALDAKDAEIAARDTEQAAKRARDAERKRDERALRNSSRRRPRTVHGRSSDCPADPPIDNTHTPCSSNDEQTPKPKSDKPEGVEPEVWTDFKALRQKLRAPITKTAMTGLAREAEKAGMSLNAALAECVERSWRGFKAEWMDNSRQIQRPGSQAPPSMLATIQRQRETGACR
jgi:hypothetical protein